MKRIEVTLLTEQRATVVVEADPNAGDKELTRLALQQLDESGGQEWVTMSGWVDRKRILTDEDGPEADEEASRS